MENSCELNKLHHAWKDLHPNLADTAYKKRMCLNCKVIEYQEEPEWKRFEPTKE